MKFLVLFLSAVVLASAHVSSNINKNVDVKEDGTIVIRGQNGKQILISKQVGPFGQKEIEIEVTGPNTITKKIQINDNNQINIEKVSSFYDQISNYQEDRNKRSSVLGQSDVFDQILNEYQTVVDEDTYQQLKSQIQNAVVQGKIGTSALNFLQVLHEQSRLNNLVSGQGVNSLVWNKHSLQNKLGLNTIYGQGISGIHGQQNKLNQLLKKLYSQQVYGQQGIYQPTNIWGIQGIQGQNNVQQLLKNILVGIFDQQVLTNVLYQQGITNQGIYEQVLNENILDNILTSQGIFDYQYLVQLISHPVLRNILVQQGIFKEAVLEQLLQTLNTQGVFNQVFLEQLVNKQMLKYWLVNQGAQNILSQAVNGNVLSNIFQNSEYYQGTPKLSYKQLVGVSSNVPELVLGNIQGLNNDDLVGIDIRKTIIKPSVNQDIPVIAALLENQGNQYSTKSGLLNTLLNGNINKVNSLNQLRNVVYGQGVGHSYGQNQGYGLQGRQGIFSQYPVVQQQLL